MPLPTLLNPTVLRAPEGKTPPKGGGLYPLRAPMLLLLYEVHKSTLCPARSFSAWLKAHAWACVHLKHPYEQLKATFAGA